MILPMFPLSPTMRKISEILTLGGSTGKVRSRELSPFLSAMPPALCCVPNCSKRKGHRFPRDVSMKKKWMIAIRRDKWVPSPFSVVCYAHFRESDYVESTVHGTSPLIKRLKKDAIPSQFVWTREISKSATERSSRAQKRSSSAVQMQVDGVFSPTDLDIGMEVDIAADDGNSSLVDVRESPEESIQNVQIINRSTQTPRKPIFGVERYIDDPKRMQQYTGCDTYEKFLLVLHSLGPAAYQLNYHTHHVKNISVENQLFMCLVKLRQHWSNSVLADFMDVSEGTVSNIFITWINFMFHQWNEVDFWPERDLVKFYSPSGFKSMFPKARVIVDGTECPIQKPSQPLYQQATFSTYKNRNTTKVLVGGSPGGLISYVSHAYGGSASDRQIVERSSLPQMCDRDDHILADKGFNVQDIFAPYDVTVTMPSFFKKKNRLDSETVQNDRKIANKRVHIERLIGLAKTFKILKHNLTSTETVLSSEIIYVCCVLCNFKDCIIPKSA